MKYFAAFTITILASFLLSGNALAGGGDAQAGKAVFETKCKMCHGADGKGNPVMAKAMNVTFPDLASPAVQGKSDDAMKKQITEGGAKMKPVKGLTDQQITDVIAFIRSLAKS
jgi:cytochrome c6